MYTIEATVFDGTKIHYAFDSFVRAHIFIKKMENASVTRNIMFEYTVTETK